MRVASLHPTNSHLPRTDPCVRATGAPRIAVVIPALNEEASVEKAVSSAFAAGAEEVVVVDGGSTDQTRAVASAAGARVLRTGRGRGRQLNHGAAATLSEGLLFLHADSMLPLDAITRAAQALGRGAPFGGFLLAFSERRVGLRLAGRLINLRTRITRLPLGDQAQFVWRSCFENIGGYRKIPILEDYDFARRARVLGPTAILSARVRTSGRRFLRLGLLRTAWRNWRIILDYHRGIDLTVLAQRYRSS